MCLKATGSYQGKMCSNTEQIVPLYLDQIFLEMYNCGCLILILLCGGHRQPKIFQLIQKSDTGRFNPITQNIMQDYRSLIPMSDHTLYLYSITSNFDLEINYRINHYSNKQNLWKIIMIYSQACNEAKPSPGRTIQVNNRTHRQAQVGIVNLKFNQLIVKKLIQILKR